MTQQPTVAPPAPGRLGEAIPAADLLPYLEGLTRWRDDRRRELSALDAAALRTPDADSYTSDLALVLSLWQGVSDRVDGLVAVWDSGRVGPREREELSRLIWGRLEQAGGVTLAEATRLCDALTAQLRARLAFDPLATDVAARIAGVRAGLFRAQELVARHRELPADAPTRVDLLRRRLEDLSRRAAAGADVSGPFAVLEADAATTERDLIVAVAGLRTLREDRAAVRARRDQLESREDALREVAARCAAAVTSPPRFAVPDLDALGPVPGDRAGLDAYAGRLDRVAAALAFAEAAYTTPLAEAEALHARLDAVEAVTGSPSSAQPRGLAETLAAARAVVRGGPVNLDAGRGLLAALEALLRESRPRRPQRAGPGRPVPPDSPTSPIDLPNEGS